MILLSGSYLRLSIVLSSKQNNTQHNPILISFPYIKVFKKKQGHKALKEPKKVQAAKHF